MASGVRGRRAEHVVTPQILLTAGKAAAHRTEKGAEARNVSGGAGRHARVLLVAANRIERDCLSRVLTAGGFEVVGEVAEGCEAIPLVCELRAAAVFMVLPLAHAVLATRRISADAPLAHYAGGR